MRNDGVGRQDCRGSDKPIHFYAYLATVPLVGISKEPWFSCAHMICMAFLAFPRRVSHKYTNLTR